MTNTIRSLTAEEINGVAGAGCPCMCPTAPAVTVVPANAVTVTQSNTGSAIATSSGGDAIAKNNQVNFNVVGVQADVKVEKFHIL